MLLQAGRLLCKPAPTWVHRRRNQFRSALRTSAVLNDSWYEGRKTNAEEESKRIIQTAAKLLLMELRNCNFGCSTYPTNEVIGNIQCNKECVPFLLRTLLESLLNNTLRQANIGQAIVYASRPRSVLPPILFGSAVEFDHLFGSKWLLTVKPPRVLLKLQRSTAVQAICGYE